MKRSLILAVIVCLWTSCVSVNATRLGTAPLRPAVSANKVAVYLTADRVPGKYEEVALLNAGGSSRWTTESEMYDVMRSRAGQYGANAIILDSMSEPSAGAKIAGRIFGISTRRKGTAIAIYVYPPEK
jgi:hypothetical protein